MHHGGGSSKRSVFWGNVSTMGMLDKGTLSRAEREKKTTIKTSRSSALNKFQKTCDRLCSFEWFALNCDCAMLHWCFWGGNPTCSINHPFVNRGKYVDKSGVARFVGDKKELKRSQILVRYLLTGFVDTSIRTNLNRSFIDTVYMVYILKLLNLQSPMWAKGLSEGPCRQHSQALRWRT